MRNRLMTGIALVWLVLSPFPETILGKELPAISPNQKARTSSEWVGREPSQFQHQIRVERDRLLFDELQSTPDTDPTPKAFQESERSGACHRHIHEALKINRERAERYSLLTGGKSRRVSRNLVYFEMACLPWAGIIDTWARKFNDRGIPIITGDFVSLDSLKPVETAPQYRNRMGEKTRNELKALLKSFRHRFFDRIRGERFLEGARETYLTLQKIREIEKRDRAHLALTVHFLESVGLGALHAVDYSAASNGATHRLSKLFLLTQLAPFYLSLSMDFSAQEIHRMGVGIVVNDLPVIPFAEEWEAFLKRP